MGALEDSAQGSGQGMVSFEISVLRVAPLILGVTLMVATVGMACLAMPEAKAQGEPGVSDDQILFGQSAVLRGPSRSLGREMRLGILAAFYEANQAGGVHGRELQLETLNDRYNPDLAFHTTRWLIETKQVFALIGAVGTPTSRVASPLAHAAGVPFIAPFTGAAFLRDPGLDNVLNLRASYHQETEEMVARLTGDLGATRVAVLYQDDAYGEDGLEGVRLALERRGLEPVGSWHYDRAIGAVRQASVEIVAANPEAVIIIGTHDPVAATVELVRHHIDPVFMTVSFGAGHALAVALGEKGHGVYATQVVPLPEDTGIPVVARYRAALSGFEPKAEPGFVSLEGYLAGRLAIFGVQACGRELTRDCFTAALHASQVIDIDGFRLRYGPDDNQGSDVVFLTMIGADGKYRQVEKLEGSH